MKKYNGGLTREQFLYYEMRTISSLLSQGFTRDEILKKVKDENLFQFPTERVCITIARCCFRRIDAIDSNTLTQLLASSSMDVGKQINLYGMMKQNMIVGDFMTTVIAEKFRTQDFSFSKKDVKVFLNRLQEQDDEVSTWADSTLNKIQQVLIRCLVECDYLDSTKSERLNNVFIVPELEDVIRENNDLEALPAFNCFR